MGADKASIKVGGVALAERLASDLASRSLPITVLGPSPVHGLPQQSDVEPGAGPAVALSRFRPRLPFVFVVSCDLPRFRADIVDVLAKEIQGYDAALPTIDGIPQYLCALYKSAVFETWRGIVEGSGGRSMRLLVEGLTKTTLDETRLTAHGIDPDWIRGANVPGDL